MPPETIIDRRVFAGFKLLIRLLLRIVCAAFGLFVGTVFSVSTGLALSDDGIHLFSVDYDAPAISFPFWVLT